MGFAILIGTLIGAVAGFTGGVLDNILMRFMDVLMAFPSLLLAIAIVAVLGTGLINAMLAIGIVSIPRFARLVRSTVLSVKELEFVDASRALGGVLLAHPFQPHPPQCHHPSDRTGHIGHRHGHSRCRRAFIPRLGAEPPRPEWGLMMGEEKNSIFSAPHLVIFPGIAIMLTVLGFNLLGDGLRDALDPRLTHGGKQ